MKLEYYKKYNIYEIRENYEKIKSLHLEKLGDTILKNDKKLKKLKDKKINNNFLKYF
jgi:hypothetical protein